VALVVVAVLFALAFVGLGRWQWHVAHGTAVRVTPSTAPTVPLTSILLPRAAVPEADISQQVSMTGRYDVSGQLVVPGRTVTGLPSAPSAAPVGVWVLTPLRTEHNVVVPVVRGWAASPADVPAPPAGEVTVTGRLYASEDSSLRNQNGDVLPAGQIDIVSGAELVSRWSGDLINGFVAAAPGQPGTDSLQPVTPTLPSGDAGLHLRNAVYAVQWWCFAILLLYFVYRVLRDEARRDQDGAAPTLTT
jgi:cytochrome oxidase assembly protein ShyY1